MKNPFSKLTLLLLVLSISNCSVTSNKNFYAEILSVPVGSTTLRVKTWGTGEPIILLSGGGQSAERFNVLAPKLAAAGYRVLAVNRRGIDGSTGPLENLTLHDYAADVAAVAETLTDGQAHILAWAFGNRVARVAASDYPKMVKSLVLLSAGGKVPPTKAAIAALTKLYTEEVSDAEELQLLSTAYFSKHSDARLWHGDPREWPAASRAAEAANQRTLVDTWWAGGEAPMLIIQGLEDQAAPPANGRLLKKAFPERVRLIEIEHAGHALLLEQPDVIAEAAINYLQLIK